MKLRIHHIIILLLFFSSCGISKKAVTDYYYTNEKTIIRIEESYKAISSSKAFSLGFTDKSYNYVSVELKTDSLKYIYDFYTDDPALKDSLEKFGYHSASVLKLIDDMRSVNCTWVNNLDYYVDGQKKYMVFMSVRARKFDTPYGGKKYYILTFYNQPQYYDAAGNLLDNKTVRKLRRIHGEIFRRINDKVCYTVSERFR